MLVFDPGFGRLAAYFPEKKPGRSGGHRTYTRVPQSAGRHVAPFDRKKSNNAAVPGEKSTKNQPKINQKSTKNQPQIYQTCCLGTGKPRIFWNMPPTLPDTLALAPRHPYVEYIWV